MKRTVWIAATAGFFMPVFWGLLSFVPFNVPEGPAADRYWQLNHIFCPFHSLSTVLELLLTTALYALIGVLIALVIDRSMLRKAA